LAASVAIAVAPGARHVAHDAAAGMLDPRGTAAHVLEGAPQPAPPDAHEEPWAKDVPRSLLNAALALLLAAVALFRHKLPSWLRATGATIWPPPMRALRAIHTG